MDFALTAEQERFREEVVRFAEAELNEDLTLRDADGIFSPEAWKKCAAFGVQGLPIPEEYGGQGADALTVALGLEALGYGCRDGGLLFSLGAQMWSCEEPILTFGSEDQRRAYLPGLCDGSLVGVQAMTEPGSGSDAFGLSTSVERRGDHYVLNGLKTFITNAPIADIFVVFATDDRQAGWAGISAFLVERDTPGLTVTPSFQKMGLRTSPMSEVHLADCELPAESLLGKPGGGMGVFNASMEWERSFILAGSVGTMQRHLEACIAHAKERKQFGQAIGRFQAVSHRIADMKVRLEAARMFLYRAGWSKAGGGDAALASSMAKLFISEAFLQSSLDAVQIHGGYGYMVESGLERELRDAVAGRIYSGTSEIQRNLIGAHLGVS